MHDLGARLEYYWVCRPVSAIPYSAVVPGSAVAADTVSLCQDQRHTPSSCLICMQCAVQGLGATSVLGFYDGCTWSLGAVQGVDGSVELYWKARAARPFAAWRYRQYDV